MANGPLGGFMPTPPSPGQPPQVKLETSAESRGNFNKFLGTLPKNGATTPIQTGVMQSSMPPVSPMTSNVNIFNPQMSQMTAMPMMPPAQPVQMMQNGGEASGEFSDTDLSDAGSFDFSADTGFNDSGDDNQESIVGDDPVADFDFNVVSTPTVTEQEQQQNIQDAETFITTPLSAPPVDTRPRTNIRNVGAGSNLRFDPQFTANLLQQRGLDPEGFMSPADFQQTTQGGGTGAAPTLSSALPSFGTGTGPLVREQLDRLRPGAGVAPVTQTAQGSRVSPTQLEFGLGLALDDPFGLGFNTAGLIESRRDVQRMRDPQQFVQEARLPSGVVPGAGGTLPDADPLAGDIIKAIRSGAAGLPFTRNPGALKQGQEDLTTEVIKELPEVALKPGQKLNQDFLAPAIFNTIDAGIQGIDRQLGLYANRPNLDITTPETLVNTYLASGNKENTPENRSAYIDAIKGVAGEKFDLNNPTTRANISEAIANQEFGQAGRDVMAEMRRGTDASILGNLNLQQLGTNVPVTSDVNQLGSLDPIEQPTQRKTFVQSQPEGSLKGTGFDFVPDAFQISNFLTQRGTAPTLTTRLIGDNIVGSDFANLATTTQNISPENTAARIARNNRTINEIRADLGSRVPDTALETLQGARGQRPAVDTVFDSPQIFGLIDRTPDLDTTRSFVGTNIDPETFTGPRKDIPNVGMIGGRRDPTPVTGEPVAELTLDDARAMGNINQERVADILNRPDRFKDTFTIGDVEFPNLIATLANKVGTMFDRRLFNAIVSDGLDAVVDPDTGRIIGAKNKLGQLIEGRDLDQFQPDDGDDDDPITTFLKKTTEDKKEEEKDTTPNVFKSSVAPTRAERPLVVESPFAESTARFTPVGFDAGNLNELIARITGVPSPRRMQEGGTVAAVDRFLSSVA